MKYTLALLLVSVALLYPQREIRAGNCTYRGYGYSSSYSQNYSPSYGDRRYYWHGGYYGGDRYYPAGSYSAGYYSYPAKSYNYYEDPVFIKYKAVIPLVELPSYGAYYQPPPPTPGTAPTASAPTATGYNPAIPTSNVEGKLDRLLMLSEQTSGRLTRLEARVVAIESKTGTTPAPEPARLPGGGEDALADVPNLFHARCASCHEEKVAATKGKKFVMFVSGPMGVEMAQKDGKGELVQIPAEAMKKIEHELSEGNMPPAKSADGKPVQGITPDERKRMIDFVKRVLTAPK